MRALAASLPLVLLAVAPAPLVSADELPDWWSTYAIGPVAPEAGTRIAVWLYDDSSGCVGTPPVDIDILLDGALLERLHAPALGPCADRSLATAPHNISAGTHEFTIVVDPDGLVAEADETDNVLTFRKIFSSEVPDVAIRVTAIEARGWPVADFVVHFEACNLGTTAPDKGIEVEGYRNNEGFDRVTLPPLLPGACLEDALVGTTEFRAGLALLGTTHHVTLDARLLPDRLRDELELDNNRASATFEVTPSSLFS